MKEKSGGERWFVWLGTNGKTDASYHASPSNGPRHHRSEESDVVACVLLLCWLCI